MKRLIKVTTCCCNGYFLASAEDKDQRWESYHLHPHTIFAADIRKTVGIL